MSVHVCKCEHNGRTEFHLRYPGLTEKQAQDIADKINSGMLDAHPQSQVQQPTHVYSVTKTGSMCEWEPTAAAFSMPDGKHALYTQPQAQELPDERAAFEAWAESEHFNIHRDDSEKYSDYHKATTRWAWSAWQARAALTAKPDDLYRERIAHGLTRAMWSFNAMQAIEKYETLAVKPCGSQTAKSDQQAGLTSIGEGQAAKPTIKESLMVQAQPVGELPPLPEPYYELSTINTLSRPGHRVDKRGYTSDQMHAYAQAAIAQAGQIEDDVRKDAKND